MTAAVGVQVYLTGPLIVPAGPIILVDWGTESKDTDGFWDSNNPSKLTIPSPLAYGWWDVTIQTAWSKNVSDVLVGVYPNGYQNGDIIRCHNPGAATTSTFETGVSPWFAGAGDFLQVQVKNNGTVDRTLLWGLNNTFLSLAFRGTL